MAPGPIPTEKVRAILDEVVVVREAADDQLDLAALGRQAELLATAHDILAQALED
ncbi:hypothetical protein [Gordonia sp. (in: high G+C Gram-positive bacteria)]|uniref:hypothetical protein n=1 Tax=Gordonia sp. (in: high G+C Gram-positive bacteria) TaxID=84139 RepID=UPI003BB537A4